MHDREILLIAARDLSIVSELSQHIADIAIEACTTDLPLLERDAHYWCFIDWLLPDLSGIELCRQLRLRPETRNAHITMLVEDDPELKQRALRSGADDYMVTPVDAAKLADRLQRYRNAGEAAPTPSRPNGGLRMDFDAMLVRHGDKRIMLAPNEFKLLAHFVDNPDRVFSRDALIAIMGKDGQTIDDRTVDVWIGRIRRALKAQGVPDRLRTVRSMGYIFDA